jgi:hypothetical protein
MTDQSRQHAEGEFRMWTELVGTNDDLAVRQVDERSALQSHVATDVERIPGIVEHQGPSSCAPGADRR